MKEKIQIFILLSVTIITACKKPVDQKTELSAIDSLRYYEDSLRHAEIAAPDTSIAIYHDTLFPPAGDQGSRTFYNLKTGMVLTGDYINKHPNLSYDIAFAYFYHNHADTLACLTNLYAYPYQSNDKWKKSVTFFRKGVPPVTYKLCNTNSDLALAYEHADAPGSLQGTAYQLSADQVIAFKTENQKFGLIKIKNLVPGNDPYRSYLTFEVKTQR
jgi:hypothetical protein